MPYPHDDALREATLSLLAQSWTKLPEVIARARGWGADWCELSTPFIERYDGQVVAHVGVIELPLVLDGRLRRCAGVHAVCTRADRRGQGHMREAMSRALSWVDGRYETALLWANDEAIYTRFGFVARPESLFVGPVRGGPADNLRLLSLTQPEDLALLRRYLDRRTPVSTRRGSIDATTLVLVDLSLWGPGLQLAHLPAHDCIVVYAVRERFLDLYDVIADHEIPLSELAAGLGERIDTAVVYFTPDRLDAPQLAPEPTTLYDTLMTRGAWPDEPLAFALPPLTRC